MGLPWIKKYSPESADDIIGQSKEMRVLKFFIENFKAQKKNAMLLHGPSGCGKTSSVYAVANELDLEVIEINASDCRNKERINSIVGSASKQMSLFGKGKLILVDELDGISGRKDFGGVAALVKIIIDSSFPVIITANNPYGNKFSSIRNKSELLQFNELSSDDIFAILKNICKIENISFEEDALKAVARRSGGDARGAVNDIEILSILGNITKESVDELSERNKTESIINALRRILKTTDPSVALGAFDSVEEDLGQCMLWLDENVPKEYTNPADLARAYDKMSKADVFNGRIRRWQHWRFLTYVNQLMTAGVAVSKDEKNREFVQYKPTGRILKMWWAKQKSMKKKAIAEKIAKKTHTSTRQMVKNIDFYKNIFQNNEEMGDAIAEELELDKDEIAWMKK